MSRPPRGPAREAPPPRRGGRWPLPAALAATLLFALWRALAGDPWTDAFDRWTVDLRFKLRGAWPAGEQAAVIAVDEAALAEAGRPAALRGALARALPAILAAEPAAVAIDLLLVDPSPSDPALAAAERLGIDLPGDRDYATVAGLALAVFRKLPAEGESFEQQGWKFEVVDLDGRRIDKLLVSVAAKAG